MLKIQENAQILKMKYMDFFLNKAINIISKNFWKI